MKDVERKGAARIARTRTAASKEEKSLAEMFEKLDGLLNVIEDMNISYISMELHQMQKNFHEVWELSRQIQELLDIAAERRSV